MRPGGKVQRIRGNQEADLWINGGFFIFRPRSLITYAKARSWWRAFPTTDRGHPLVAFTHEGFWRPVDTLKDKQVLADLVENGSMPCCRRPPGPLNVERNEVRGCLSALPSGASDCRYIASVAQTISKSAGATILNWIEMSVRLKVYWAILGANGSRHQEALSSAQAFLGNATNTVVDLATFKKHATSRCGSRN